jgi:nucleoid-associated protein YgaU
MNAKPPVNIDEPEPNPETDLIDSENYIVQKGDSIWKIAKKRLPSGINNSVIFDYVRQIAQENGMSPELIDGILSKTPGDPDLIFPGDKLTIYPYSPK